MRFSVNKTELQNALGVVLKGVANQNTDPVLAGVLIESLEDKINFRTTNTVLSIQYETLALVEEAGRAVVPCRLLNDIIKSLPDCAVQIEIADGEAHIECDNSSFTIKTIDAEEFPDFPHVEVDQQISIPFELLSSMVRRVSRAVSRDESRKILTGILVSVENGILSLVATDSYRLAVTSHPIEGAEDFSAVISGTFMSDITSLQAEGENVSLALADNQIVVECKGVVFINRRIEGTYPPYKQLQPTGNTMKLEVSTADFTAAVKRAALMGENNSSLKIKGDPDGGFMQISAATLDVGSVVEQVNCSGTGEETEIGFNCSYILDGLASIGSKTLFFETNSSSKPGILRATGDEDFWYLVMPVRIM